MASSFFRLFQSEKRGSAQVAKERLSIILARETVGGNGSPDFIPKLQKELMEVISRYVQIDPRDIVVNVERQGDLEVLEVKIELPDAQ